MKKILIAALTAASMLAMPVSAQQVLRVSHNAAPGNPKSDASLLFAKLVEEKTDGRLKVEVGGSAQYGEDVEAITNMRLGTLAFAANSQGPVSGTIPEFSALGLPFLFRDLEHAYKVIDGPVGEKLAELADAKGLVLLALWDNGIRHTSNNVRPIETPEDLAGLKIRTPPDPITIDIFTALGANPSALAFSELYIALQQGVVDGQENPLMNIYSSKLHEVQKYITFTGHKYESTPFLASKIIFNSLSAEDQEAVREAAIEAGKFNREASLKSDQELKATLEEAGIQFNEIDPAPFVEKTKSVYEEWEAKHPEIVKLVVEEAQKQ